MSAQVMPAKRPLDQNNSDANGRKKSQKSSALGSDSAPFTGSLSSKVIRVLCPASKIDGIIGDNGDIISQICQESGAEVHVEDSVPGCDERVIVIARSGKGEKTSDEVKVEGEETIPDEREEGDEKQDIAAEDSGSEKEKESASIQKALLAVSEKMVDILSEINIGDEESNKPSSSVVRLLVFSSQVGCLLGKAGSVIKQMSSESGAQIRILPKDKLPSCASSSDELVQISGGLDSIRKALVSVSQQLLDHNLRNQDFASANVVGPSSHSLGPPPKQDKLPPRNRPFLGRGAPYPPAFHDGEVGIRGRMNFRPETLTFRLLCNEEKVGGVIGKGGSIVKALQHESGCEIKVLEGTGNSEDRIIIIAGPAYPDDSISPPQDAVLRVQSRIFRSAPESKDNSMIAKLLVGSHQIGCLLGKGGSVIAEMRKTTGAYIRILGKDQVPKSALGNEEVVQVSGDFEVVQEALVQITSRLKNHLYRDFVPPPNPAFAEHMHQFPPYMARREFSPSGAFSNRGPPFNKFDGPGGPHPGDGFHLHDDQAPFMHDFPRPGVHPHMPERMSSGAPWGPQGPMAGPGPMAYPDYPGGPQRRFGGFAGGNQPTVVTNTTMEVVVPRFVVPAIMGEDGACYEQILELSEAKVTITDPKPGASETKIIISGTPDQAYAAQSLIQAFVLLETGGAS